MERVLSQLKGSSWGRGMGPGQASPELILAERLLRGHVAEPGWGRRGARAARPQRAEVPTACSTRISVLLCTSPVVFHWLKL